MFLAGLWDCSKPVRCISDPKPGQTPGSHLMKKESIKACLWASEHMCTKNTIQETEGNTTPMF